MPDGLMGYRTPSIDRIAAEGMRFTDSSGEQSCTAGAVVEHRENRHLPPRVPLHRPPLTGYATGTDVGGRTEMATKKQVEAAKRNVKKAQSGAKQKRSIANMPAKTRTALGKQGAAVAKRKRSGGSSPKTRQELYEEAKRRNLPGRSKMGRDELARALGRK